MQGISLRDLLLSPMPSWVGARKVYLHRGIGHDMQVYVWVVGISPVVKEIVA